MDSKYWGTEVAYKNGYAAGVKDAAKENEPAPTTSLPSNWCGECPVWLAQGDMEGLAIYESMATYCTKCHLFTNQQFIRHIPSGAVYPLEPDGKTIIICGADLSPTPDGVFWEYVDKYEYRRPVPVDPYHKLTKEKSNGLG